MTYNVLQPPIVFAITVIILCKYIVSFSQLSKEAPLDRQHTLFNRWRSTQFIVNIFEYYELVVKLIVFPELQHFLLSS